MGRSRDGQRFSSVNCILHTSTSLIMLNPHQEFTHTMQGSNLAMKWSCTRGPASSWQPHAFTFTLMALTPSSGEKITCAVIRMLLQVCQVMIHYQSRLRSCGGSFSCIKDLSHSGSWSDWLTFMRYSRSWSDSSPAYAQAPAQFHEVVVPLQAPPRPCFKFRN